jgi:hypothetical protein
MTRARDVADVQDNLGGAVAPFVAGKNKLINGDFYWNQRNFTSVTTSATYCFDRFRTSQGGGTVTTTPQTFAPGAAPVAGYEGRNFVQTVVSGQTGGSELSSLIQNIEDVRTFAGQTVTFSFWIRVTSGSANISVELGQYFGTGGSPSASVNTGTTKKAISTSWARYSFTLTVPSISGKTIGTNNDDCLTTRIWFSAGPDFNSRSDSLGIQNNTFQTWGWQVEAGSVATPFTTASGSIGGELALCQRYYQKSYPAAIPPGSFFLGAYSTTIVENNIPSGNYFHYQPLIVQMRAEPTITIFSGAGQTSRVSTTGGSDLAALSAVPILVADNHFTIQNQSGGALSASNGGFLFYYVASSEL